MQYECCKFEILCLKISKIGIVAALAGRLFQLAIVRGKMLNLTNCLPIRGGVEKLRNACREGLTEGISWGEVQRDYAM